MQQDSDPKHSSNVWARISPQSCERLIKSYIKPLLQVIAAKGGSTGYWIFVCLYIYGEHGLSVLYICLTSKRSLVQSQEEREIKQVAVATVAAALWIREKLKAAFYLMLQ